MLTVRHPGSILNTWPGHCLDIDGSSHEASTAPDLAAAQSPQASSALRPQYVLARPNRQKPNLNMQEPGLAVSELPKSAPQLLVYHEIVPIN